MKAALLLFAIALGVWLIFNTGTGVKKDWPQRLRNELKGWKTSYFTNTPFAGSSSPS